MARRLVKFRYELQTRLSDAPWYEVWRGVDRMRNEPVVVRLLKGPFARRTDATKAWVKRLNRQRVEPQPRCATVIEVGFDEDVPFFVREHVEGATLERWMNERHSPDEVFGVLAEVTAALAECHAAGTAYGYLHPGNIVLTDDGPVFCDHEVGAATRLFLGRAETRAKNEPYLAPEVRAGQHPRPESDVYSLGVALFELLTGVRLAPGGGRNPAAELPDGLPVGLDVVMEGMLRPDPDDRYPAAQAAQALAKLRTRSERQTERTPRELRRQRTRERANRARKPLPWPIVVIWVCYRLLFILVGTAVISVATMGVGSVGIYRYIVASMPEEVIVPDVTGMTRADAEELLSESFGLTLKVVLEQASRTVSPGCVVETRPSPGRRVREGRVLEAVLSTGPELVTVPRLVESPQSDAQDRILRLGLRIGVLQQVPDDRLPSGYIISQNPGPGRRVESGTPVDMKVSTGPPNGREVAPPPASSSNSTDQKPHKVGKVRIVVPSDPKVSWVKIVIRDDDGERTVYNKLHYAGDVVRQTVEGVGETVVEVYLNNNQVQSKVL